MNGRLNHPRARFDRYVEQTWGKEGKDLSAEDRDLAIADWQVSEMARRLGNGSRRWQGKALDVTARGGPWAMAITLMGLLLKGSGG